MNSPAKRDDTSRVWLLGILGLALVIRLVYLWQYASLPDWEFLTVDNWYHHNWARTIADGNVAGDTTYFRAPFYVWCLGLLYAVFSESLWTGRLFGLVIGLVSVGLTCRLGSKLFDRRIGLVAALLHAVYPMAVYLESELLLDPLFTLFMQLVLIKTVSWYERPDLRNTFLLGVLIGLAAITRPTVLVFVPVLLAVILWQNKRVVRPLLKIFGLVVGIALLILPITVRNLLVADDPVLIASQGGINLYIGNHLEADGLSAAMPDPLGHNWQISDITFLAEQDRNEQLSPGEVSSYWTDQTLTVWVEHRLHSLELFGRKLLYNFTGERVSNNRALDVHFHLVPLLHYHPFNFTVLFALVGLGVVGAARLPSGRLLLLLAVVYLAATALFFFAERFRMPLLPPYFVIAAAAPFDLWRRARSLPVSLVYPVIGVVVALLLSLLPVPKSPGASLAAALNSEGLHHYYDGRFEAARQSYQQAMRVDSALVDLNLNLGATFLRLGQIDSAVYYFEREIGLHPGRPEAHANLASVALLQDQPEHAVELTDRALPLQPYHSLTNRVRLRAVFAVDTLSRERLLEEVSQARSRTDDAPRLLLDAGLLLSERGMFDAAERVLLDLVARPVPPIETDDNAFTQDFVNDEASQQERVARALYQLGFISGLTQRFYDAVNYSRRAIETDSSLVEAWVNLAAAYRSTGDFAAADSVYREAVRRFESHPAIEHLRRMWE